MTLPSLPWRVQMYHARAVIVGADLVSFEVILAQHGGEVPDVRDSRALAEFIVRTANGLWELVESLTLPSDPVQAGDPAATVFLTREEWLGLIRKSRIYETLPQMRKLLEEANERLQSVDRDCGGVGEQARAVDA